jgi:hypothetical protein
MTALKTLAIAAALAAVVATPAKAEPRMVYLDELKPVACRNLNDAIEASKFNGWENMRDYQEKREFVKRHGFSKSVLFNDCVIAGNQANGEVELKLMWAIQIKTAAPGLPAGMIATCVVVPGGLPNLDGSRAPDCTGTAVSTTYDRAVMDAGKPALGYWVVTKPEALLRNFDLPKGE